MMILGMYDTQHAGRGYCAPSIQLWSASWLARDISEINSVHYETHKIPNNGC